MHKKYFVKLYRYAKNKNVDYLLDLFNIKQYNVIQKK